MMKNNPSPGVILLMHRYIAFLTVFAVFAV